MEDGSTCRHQFHFSYAHFSASVKVENCHYETTPVHCKVTHWLSIWYVGFWFLTLDFFVFLLVLKTGKVLSVLEDL